ncbi:MAG: DUF6261 family protein [Dysgonamonadaceae bacterium]|jgi:hypothetical protein|nr:DUF6261 family protein [Dysgonamonadaceae bacterium]
MLILRLKLNRLRNEEWFNFFTEFKTLVTQATPAALNIEALFATFVTLYKQADEALEILRKSSYTEDIIAFDGKRDNAFHGLSENIRSYLSHFVTLKREAAQRLVAVLDHYGNLARKPFNEETAGIVNFIQELRNNYPEQVQTLGLVSWIGELEEANNEFEAAILARNAEIAARPDLKMLEVRRETDRNYLQTIERIEALTLINGDDAYSDFITKLNANVERYKNVLSRRGTHKQKETA